MRKAITAPFGEHVLELFVVVAPAHHLLHAGEVFHFEGGEGPVVLLRVAHFKLAQNAGDGVGAGLLLGVDLLDGGDLDELHRVEMAAIAVERVAADVEAEQFFFKGENFIRRPDDGGRCRLVLLRFGLREFEIVEQAALAGFLSFCIDAAEASTCSSLANMTARSSPVKSKAPDFTRASMSFLFTARLSRRAAKSSRLVKGPFFSRSAMAASMAPSPTFLIALRP
jgi:hypothetical protein